MRDTAYCPNIRTMPFDVLRGCGMGRVSEGPIYSPAMFPLLQSVQMLLLMFAGWVNRHQLDVIEYLQEENRVPIEARRQNLRASNESALLTMRVVT